MHSSLLYNGILISIMKVTTRGFTIVELLIVIVVIAILATITIVTYNGIQNRTSNIKTISAAKAWVAAIKLYEIDKAELPHMSFDACLGSDYPWDYTGTTSGSNQCISSPTANYFTESKSVSLRNALAPYIGNKNPTPDLNPIGTTGSWRRGIVYRASVVGENLQLSMALIGASACPDIGSAPLAQTINYSNGKECLYDLGLRLR
jgi:prepilin-type N-terminal cleavage/methylation domain-containing protein